MYCRLLDEAIRALRDGPQAEPRPDPIIELQIDAYIPNDYIEDAMHKIELYQHIAAVRTEEQVADLIDAMIDRFGDPPEPLNNLMTVARLRNCGRRMGVKSIIEKNEWFEISFSDQPDVNVAGLMEIKAKNPSRVRMMAGPPQMISFKKGSEAKVAPAAWLLALFLAIAPQTAS